MSSWLAYNFAPAHEPWWHGNIYGNIWAWILCGVLAGLWIRAKLIAHKELLEEIHHRLHTGIPHPRVQQRIDAGEHPTLDRP